MCWLIERLDADIFELSPHGLAGVQLDGEDTIEQRELGGVCEIENLAAIHEVLNVSSLADDHDLIPIIELEQRLEFFFIDQFAGHVLLVAFPRGDLADHADASAFPAFVVNETGDIREADFIAAFVLVAADDPVILDGLVGDVFGAILDTRVVGRVTAKRKSQFKVFGRAVLPNEECVSLGSIFGRRLAMNHAIADRPKSWIAAPAREVLAVEYRRHARFRRSVDRSFGMEGGECENGKCQRTGQETQHVEIPRGCEGAGWVGAHEYAPTGTVIQVAAEENAQSRDILLPKQRI